MKVDLETMKVIKELLTHQHYGEIVPTHAAPKDTFSEFTSGLRNNWVFVIAVIGFSLWLLNSINGVQNINTFQDAQIKTNIADISQNATNIDQLNKNITTLNQSQITNYNELVRRLDSLQSSIDALKEK